MRLPPVAAHGLLVAVVLIWLCAGGALGGPRPEALRLEAHAATLRARLPRAFTVVVEPPFVMAGDAAPERVRRDARNVVAWAVRLLTRQYFKKPPTHIIDIYLFKDAQSYQRNVQTMFGETPGTPYGYYSSRHHALIMNIATGGGTLVHEIVHPYMHANFAACPPWFNEGLASLYEACAERDGRIVGLVNWRLPGLLEAIRAGRTVPLETLMALDADRFYADRGMHYAMARYLCYYLQERGLLDAFYRDFVRDHESDPTGFGTLRRILGEPDMTAFQQRWEQYCLALPPP